MTVDMLNGVQNIVMMIHGEVVDQDNQDENNVMRLDTSSLLLLLL